MAALTLAQDACHELEGALDNHQCQCESDDCCVPCWLKEHAAKMPYALDLLRSTASGFLPGDDYDQCEADADRLGEAFDRPAGAE